MTAWDQHDFQTRVTEKLGSKEIYEANIVSMGCETSTFNELLNLISH